MGKTQKTTKTLLKTQKLAFFRAKCVKPKSEGTLARARKTKSRCPDFQNAGNLASCLVAQSKNSLGAWGEAVAMQEIRLRPVGGGPLLPAPVPHTRRPFSSLSLPLHPPLCTARNRRPRTTEHTRPGAADKFKAEPVHHDHFNDLHDFIAHGAPRMVRVPQ